MGERRTCDECGAPVPEGKAFCDYCGAFVGIGGDEADDSAREGTTERMPQARPMPQRPVPLTEARRSASGASARVGDAAREDGRAGGGPRRRSLALPVVTVVLGIAVAGLVGYLVGTSRQASTGGGNGEGIPSASPSGGTGESASSPDAMRKPAADEGQAERSAARPADAKPPEDEAQRRMREAIPAEIPLGKDGQLDVALTVPDGGISMRVEIRQGGRSVYESRILAPGERLGKVPADGAEVGATKVTAYGVVGDADYGTPVTVDAKIVPASE